MPADFTETERAIWRQVIECMPPGIITRADSGMLESYCRAKATVAKADAELARIGWLVKGRQGEAVKNPWSTIRAQAAKEQHRAAVELGLTPQSRVRLVGQGGKEMDDPLALLVPGSGFYEWEDEEHMGSRH